MNNNLNNQSELSLKQLREVFKLCDPSRTGKVKTEDLKNLARFYVGDANNDAQNFNQTFKELDPFNRGVLSFGQFCAGIKSIVHRKQYDFEKAESPDYYLPPSKTYTPSTFQRSMMSPTQASIAEHDLRNTSEETENLSPPESPRRGETTTKSQCSSLSDGDNYEWTAGDMDADSGVSSDRNLGEPMETPSTEINRNAWLRTSLRRSPSNHENLPNRRWGSFRHAGKRQLGSNALASPSFNSSGRSSTCDTVDDMYSDASLEEDVHDLHHKVQVLQQQVGVLQDTSHQTDERYTRAKSDNASLQARVIMLEEQLRDTEMRYEERLQEAQKRSKEKFARLEREKQLQLENASIRLHAAETESSNLKEEVNRQRVRIEKLETERRELTDQIQDLTNDIISAKELTSSYKEQEKRLKLEQESNNQLIEDLSQEVERLRNEARTPALPTTAPETLRLEELHEEMSALREKNSQLEEANEELQANLLHAGLEQGKKLTAAGNSLAAELEAMSQDENNINTQEFENVAKIQHALKEQQEVNIELRTYIDGILLNIVENYPQLLEVKRTDLKNIIA